MSPARSSRSTDATPGGASLMWHITGRPAAAAASTAFRSGPRSGEQKVPLPIRVLTPTTKSRLAAITRVSSGTSQARGLQ